MINTYPRPQLKRDSFYSLNGMWSMNGKPICVPYPPQADFSGWQGDVPENLVYRKEFDLPSEFHLTGFKTILHFGAVDQTARVYLNDSFVCAHEGGYLPFSADITSLIRTDRNELKVEVTDDLSHDYPYGKQCRKPHGMWYTPVSGIWQTVWLEQVPEQYITGLKIATDLDSLTLTVESNTQEGKAQVKIDGLDEISIAIGRPTRIVIPEPKLWTPESPHLYSFSVRFSSDRVSSYFALRTISVSKDTSGNQVIALNGRPFFLNGLLDQGYFPEGLFLPETENAYCQDVLNAKALGYNILRKHIKIEPEAFYEACDRLGMLVIHDMVNAGPYHYIWDTVLPNLGFKYRPDFVPGGKKRKSFFEAHCRGIQDHLDNHPCVIAYTIFNEGWGQYDTTRIYRMLKPRDPSRLYISVSGWFKGYETDIDTEHIYFRNKVLKRKKRPLLLTECGGYTYDAKPGIVKDTYGYGNTDSPAELTERIETLFREMVFPSIEHGLNGVIYTQLTDVEGEINGLYTYDRQTCKVIPERLKSLSHEAMKRFASIVIGDEKDA